MPYSPKAIANELLDLAERAGRKLTPMKIQKLVYFAHGWHSAITGKPLINEQVEAWKFGPVIRSLYAQLADYGNRPISSKLESYDAERKSSGGFSIRSYTPCVDGSPEDVAFVRELLKKVWDTYGGYTAIQLSNLTHESGTPWDQVSNKCGGELPKGTDIPLDLIRNYYVARAKR